MLLWLLFVILSFYSICTVYPHVYAPDGHGQPSEHKRLRACLKLQPLTWTFFLTRAFFMRFSSIQMALIIALVIAFALLSAVEKSKADFVLAA